MRGRRSRFVRGPTNESSAPMVRPVTDLGFHAHAARPAVEARSSAQRRFPRATRSCVPGGRRANSVDTQPVAKEVISGGLRAVAGRAGVRLGSQFASSWDMGAALHRALHE
jgi:hypothetical protein